MQSRKYGETNLVVFGLFMGFVIKTTNRAMTSLKITVNYFCLKNQSQSSYLCCQTCCTFFQEQLYSLNSSTTNPKRGLPAQNVLPSWKWTRSNPAPSSLNCEWTVFYLSEWFERFLCRLLKHEVYTAPSRNSRYKKPTDFKRKKLQLLTKKQLYLHLHQTLHKDS